MRILDTSTPVIVLKAEHYAALGIIRSLGSDGIRVFAVDPFPHAPGFASRYCAGNYVWNIEKATVESSLDMLSRIHREIGSRPLIIPTSDEVALFVAQQADILKDWFLFSHQKVELVQALCSKKEMFHLAKTLDVAVPKTFFPESKEDVLEIAAGEMFPLALKGIDGGRLERWSGKKMILVHGKDELLRQYAVMEDPANRNLMIQEYIPGPEDASWMFNGYIGKGAKSVVAFTGKKIRQNPVHSGMTSLGVCARNDSIVQISNRFLRQIGYEGIVDIDFRYDDRDGLYKILDVNPRIGATFRLFVGRNGVDLAKAMYLDLTGQKVPPTVARDGRKWIVEDKDVLSSYRYIRDTKLTLGKWFVSLRGIEEAGYFSLRDQRPFWVMWWNHCVRKISQLLNRRRRAAVVPEATRRKVPEPFGSTTSHGRLETPQRTPMSQHPYEGNYGNDE